MKKGIVFLFFIGLLISCSTNVETNDDPTIQGLKDNVEWESYTVTGEVAGTTVTLTGVGSGTVKLKMKLPSGEVEQTDETTWIGYPLGTGTTNQAFYTVSIQGKEYTYRTANKIGDGEFVVTNFDGETISGKFNFNAINTVTVEGIPSSVNFNKGIFYNIPLTYK
ncbi:MAG TPA: DUF6252 family protein [Flavobacterium sp.]|jgi:hypothetical protein|nr:DUF6252 family protein [Flavobacterium sp.]